MPWLLPRDAQPFTMVDGIFIVGRLINQYFKGYDHVCRTKSK